MFEHFAKQIVPESSPKGRFRWGLRGVPLKDCIVFDGTVAMSSRRIPALLGVLCMLIPMLTGSITATNQDDPPEGLAPEDIWSEDYANDVYPWGGNDRIQFKARVRHWVRPRVLQSYGNRVSRSSKVSWQ